MKRTKYIFLLASLIIAAAGCNDDFLEEKRDLTGTNEEVFQEPQLASGYVDYIYGLFSPANNGIPNVQSQSNAENGAFNTAWTQTTDEMSGENDWNKVWPSIAYTQNHAVKYFGQAVGTSIANNTWTRMKQINIFLTSIDKYSLTDAVKDPLKGQMYFWRAYQYFELVKLYGGVPLVLEPANPILDGNTSSKIQRSSTDATISQIVADLDQAIKLLPAKWPASDWGRITSGAAAALKGRVLLTYASPQFNRADDRVRWQKAYDANLAAKTLLDANGFGLYNVGGTANGTAWANMFLAEGYANTEAIWTTGFNTVASGNSQRNNGWEQAIRPKDIGGGGSVVPTKQIVDAFPMKDGKMPGSSIYTYDAVKIYKNRDPRFAKTFIWNGALYPYNGASANRAWTYTWKSASSATKYDKSTEKAATATGFYLCKASNTAAAITNGSFSISGTDYIEIRYAEVLLNLAESAAGIDKVTDGLGYIQQVRARAGVENKDGMYGLSGIASRDQAFGAVINERKVEFAYENKRFWDLRRWLLFNNDFGTCTRLGQTPIDGMRRQGYYFSARNSNGTDYVHTSADPFVKPASGSAPLIDRDATTYPAGVANADAYVDYIYDNYLKVSVKDDVDPTTGWKFKWYNEYYFFGINSSVLNTSSYLNQTIGWNSLTGNGTFDPLK
ncbi:RagB/SusD family nutrient uptake outer membrane protein [Hufsiella ginkgonis]|uniref:RagB/SusD family nutrient uptake outer membrane protein n=1 Tax=Hufsiella ginkgonis TaxID=2695274 RepID=A0A7K1XXF5_9SPHI|nr:RagB/SusD family nutrient uptake outer membrane protein [Hufsiella ginkgonis]MXV15196.1 RagB/SusD family nutrient uptake outer membrane protein [Hufsiella ginkgonis]